MQDSQILRNGKEQPIAEVSNDDYVVRLAEKEANWKELEENRRKIVEFSKKILSLKENTQKVYEPQNSKQNLTIRNSNLPISKV